MYEKDKFYKPAMAYIIAALFVFSSFAVCLSTSDSDTASADSENENTGSGLLDGSGLDFTAGQTVQQMILSYGGTVASQMLVSKISVVPDASDKTAWVISDAQEAKTDLGYSSIVMNSGSKLTVSTDIVVKDVYLCGNTTFNIPEGGSLTFNSLYIGSVMLFSDDSGVTIDSTNGDIKVNVTYSCDVVKEGSIDLSGSIALDIEAQVVGTGFSMHDESSIYTFAGNGTLTSIKAVADLTDFVSKLLDFLVDNGLITSLVESKISESTSSSLLASKIIEALGLKDAPEDSGDAVKLTLDYVRSDSTPWPQMNLGFSIADLKTETVTTESSEVSEVKGMEASLICDNSSKKVTGSFCIDSVEYKSTENGEEYSVSVDGLTLGLLACRTEEKMTLDIEKATYKSGDADSVTIEGVSVLYDLTHSHLLDILSAIGEFQDSWNSVSDSQSSAADSDTSTGSADGETAGEMLVRIVKEKNIEVAEVEKLTIDKISISATTEDISVDGTSSVTSIGKYDAVVEKISFENDDEAADSESFSFCLQKLKLDYDEDVKTVSNGKTNTVDAEALECELTGLAVTADYKVTLDYETIATLLLSGISIDFSAIPGHLHGSDSDAGTLSKDAVSEFIASGAIQKIISAVSSYASSSVSSAACEVTMTIDDFAYHCEKTDTGDDHQDVTADIAFYKADESLPAVSAVISATPVTVSECDCYDFIVNLDVAEDATLQYSVSSIPTGGDGSVFNDSLVSLKGLDISYREIVSDIPSISVSSGIDSVEDLKAAAMKAVSSIDTDSLSVSADEAVRSTAVSEDGTVYWTTTSAENIAATDFDTDSMEPGFMTVGTYDIYFYTGSEELLGDKKGMEGLDASKFSSSMQFVEIVNVTYVTDGTADYFDAMSVTYRLSGDEEETIVTVSDEVQVVGCIVSQSSLDEIPFVVPAGDAKGIVVRVVSSTDGTVDGGKVIFKPADGESSVVASKTLVDSVINAIKESSDNAGSLPVMIDTTVADMFSASFDNETLKSIVESGLKLDITSSAGTISLDNDVVKSFADNGPVTVTLENLDINDITGVSPELVKEVGSNPVIKISNSQGLHLLNGKATVTVHWEKPADATGVPAAWYLNTETNQLERISDVTYDAEAQTLTFTVDHMSLFSYGTAEPVQNGNDNTMLIIGAIVVVAILILVGVVYLRSRASKPAN